MQSASPTFEDLRPDLFRLAYRMLGSRADADDILQEAFLRWSNVDIDNVDSPKAYLSSIVTRLCIDRRRSIDARKESYIGPWLPEPIVESAAAAPDHRLETAESVSMALLVLLESLSPVERAAYLLRRVFDYDYAELGRILHQSEANCRQLVSRAEKHITDRRPRFEASAEQAEQITETFLQSCITGDYATLTRLLAEDAVTYSDGGGKALAALAPIHGPDRIARFLLGIAKRQPDGSEIRRVQVNGQPGIMAIHQGVVQFVLTLDIVEGQIANCYIIRNPDKLPPPFPSQA